MKNRLQFNRHYAEYQSREEALTAFRARITDPDFIPLIGEPIVLRYKDENDKLQLILAVGKKGGRSLDEREYHFIDTAELDEKLAAEIAAREELDAETIKNIFFNDVEAEISDNVASLSVSANSIPIGNYENYDGKARKPHPIHDNYSTLDAIKQLDLNFLDFTEKVDEKVDGLKIAKVDEPLPANVREAYDLLDKDNNRKGDRINIYKDSSLIRAYLGHADDYLADPHSPEVTEGTGDAALCLIYQDVEGLYTLIPINVETFIEENEFADGFEVNNHVVSLKIDDNSENFISVGEDGLKLSGIQDAIDSAKTSEQERAMDVESALQEELDKTQIGAGLADDGSYVHDHDTHYIGNAHSLAEADHALDAALFELSGLTVENGDKLDSEIARATSAEDYISAVTDNIIKAAGLVSLTEEGTYPKNHHSGATVIGPADSLDDADMLLDFAVGSVSAMVIELSAATTTSDVVPLSAAVINLSAATSGFLDKLNNLSGATEAISGSVENLSGVVMELSSATNDRIDELSGYTKDIDDEVKELSGFVINAISELDDKVADVDDRISEFSGAVEGIELTVAASLNDLNDRIIELSGNTARLEDVALTGVSVNGVAQPVSNHVADIQISIPAVGSFFDEADYDTNTKRINFYNDGTVIDYIDATDFIKDGMLNNVEVITLTGETYLRFTFNTDAGKEAIDIKVSDFAALYEAGSGITITDDNEIQINLANKGDSSYIKLDSDGLYLTGVSAMADEIQALSAGTQHDIEVLSGDVVEYVKAVSGNIETVINSLSAGTTAISESLAELSGMTELISGFAHDKIVELSGDVVNYVNVASGNIIDYVNGISGDVISYVDESVENLSGDVITYMDDAIRGLSGDVIAYADDILDSGLSAFSGVVEDYINEVISGISFECDKTLGSGYTYSGIPYVNSSTTFADAYSALTNEFLTDEEAVAASLNDLNVRIANIPDCSEGLQELSAAVKSKEYVAAQAFNDLNSRILDIVDRLDIIEDDSWLYNKLLNMLSGTSGEIKITGNSGTITIGYDN